MPDEKVQSDRYAVQHVNYGSDDGTPSSKMRIEFDCPTYTIARKAMDIIAAQTPYRKSRLVLLHLNPHDNEHSIHNGDGIFGDSTAFRKPPTQVERKQNHFIKTFINQKAQVSPDSDGSGRFRSRNCIVTGPAFLSAKIKTIHKVHLFDEDWNTLGDGTTMRYDLVVEIKLKGTTKENVWISARALRFHGEAEDAMRLGLIEMMSRKVIGCPHCKTQIFSEDISLGKSGMKSNSREEHIICYVCTKKFLMVRER